MKTAVVGLGNIGATVAAHLVAGGQDILVVDHNPGKAEAFAKQSGGKAHAATLDQALGKADIIVMAVYFEGIQDLLKQHQTQLKGKILVDPSNPIAPDGKGGFKKIIPEQQSSGQILAGLLPSGTRLVKAFGTLGAASLKSGARRKPEPAVLFYAADDEAAGKTVAGLIEAAGFAPVRVGGLDQSIRIEVFGDLHEFGKLGKLVSAQEAAALV
jgi:8-hydroxy-5-deazaflavin:NADPH oxidoreductase